MKKVLMLFCLLCIFISGFSQIEFKTKSVVSNLIPSDPEVDNVNFDFTVKFDTKTIKLIHDNKVYESYNVIIYTVVNRTNSFDENETIYNIVVRDKKFYKCINIVIEGKYKEINIPSLDKDGNGNLIFSYF